MPDTDINPAPISIKLWGDSSVKVNAGGQDRILPLSGLESEHVNWSRSALETGRTLEALRAAVQAFLIRPYPAPELIPSNPVKLYTRNVRETRDAGECEDLDPITLKSALEGDKDLIEWPRGLDQLACLDIDFHGVTPPEWIPLLTSILAAGVTPTAVWRSMSGGAHALYWAMDGFTAGEIASAVAVELCGDYAVRLGTFEVISKSRTPDVPVQWFTQEIDSVLRSWRSKDLRDPDDSEIEEFRNDRGWTGRDGLHEDCPGDPGHKSSKASSRPLFFGNSGVTCLSCKARGLRSFWSWGALLDGSEHRPNKVRQCAEYLTDWTHAAYVLQEAVGSRLSESDQKRAYFALCKLLHAPDDPRIRRLARDKDGDFIRGDGCWLDPITMTVLKPSKEYFRALPSNLYVRDDDSLGMKLGRIERCLATGELPGYPPIIPVRGIQLWGQFMDYPSMTDSVRVPNYNGDGDRPRYVSPEGRDVEGAWAELQRRFPGLSRDYVELLLVARGAAESGAGRVPRIIVTGPSGSAKSTTVQLAASILGDVCANVPWSNPRTFREIFDDAVVNTAGFVLCDEFAKAGSGKNSIQGNPYSMFLGMESRVHKARLLYIGPVTMRNMSAVIVTGVQVSPILLKDKQLQRRFIHVPLHATTPERWERTCGFSDVANLRSALPDECNAILSDIVDRFFTHADSSAFDLEVAAENLGFTLLCDSPMFESPPIAETDTPEDRLPESPSSFSVNAAPADPFSSVANIQRLYELSCTGEGCSVPPRRFAARGRVRFGVFDETEIAKVYRELWDGSEDADSRLSSERIAEVDMREILGVTRNPGVPVWCEIKGDWNSVCIRFGMGTGRQRPIAIGAELMANG